MTFQETLREAAAQGIVLLKNEGATLPFTAEDSVAIFGRAQINYYKSGTGSGGSVHVPFSVNLIDGIERLKGEGFPVASINTDLVSIYRDWIQKNPFNTGNGEWASEPWWQVEMPVTDSLATSAAKKSEKAVYIIGRTAGEDQDNRPQKGSYYLTDEELKNLEVLSVHFKKITVVLNVSNIIDTSWVESPVFKGRIGALLYSWQGGMQGGQGLADVLFGKKSPSGKLADSIAWEIQDHPSTKNFGSAEDELYCEDIYVGYRYFSTFAPHKIQYPFGFGKSYTDFRIENKRFEFGSGEFTVEVEVFNQGNFTARETVQVYCEPPQGKLGKPARILVGFAKTVELKPGESETLEISFGQKDFASYDDHCAKGDFDAADDNFAKDGSNAADERNAGRDADFTGFEYSYVLEEGVYHFYAGTDSTNGKKLFTAENTEFSVQETFAVEKLSNAAGPTVSFKRIRPKKLQNGVYEIGEENVPLYSADISSRIGEAKSRLNRFENRISRAIDFSDVVKEPSLVEDFIATLSDAELMTLVRGEGMMSRKVTPGVASAFGGLSESLHAKKIPAVACCDGPSGIRFDNGKEASLVPIGTLLACTWNTALVEEVFEFIGREMLENQCDVLLGPGCNIHRNPLNGRNFEYFSEDPLVSGLMASSVCRGLSKSGAIGTVKHFALNNQESNRRTQNSVVSERALREIYLRPFEIAVKNGGAASIMTSYNGVNGHKAASNFDLDTTILRGEWNFSGLVMTDWWAAMNDCEKGGASTARKMSQMIRARNNVYMVVANDTAEKGGFGDDLEESLANGSLSRQELELSVKDILLFVAKTAAAKRPARPLKNEVVLRNFIESVPEGERVLHCGENADAKTLQKNAYYRIAKDGAYNVCGSFIKDGGETLSQSVTNVLINGQVCGSFECRSTDGKNVWATAVQLFLKSGVYSLGLDATKPGITVNSVAIVPEGESPISAGVYE